MASVSISKCHMQASVNYVGASNPKGLDPRVGKPVPHVQLSNSDGLRWL